MFSSQGKTRKILIPTLSDALAVFAVVFKGTAIVHEGGQGVALTVGMAYAFSPEDSQRWEVDGVHHGSVCIHKFP